MTGRRTHCAECGEVLVFEGKGRPPKYCSPVCTRSAEYTLRRAQALLKRAESKLQDTKVAAAVADSWQRREIDKRADFWAAEIERLKREMRVSLAGGTTTGGSVPVHPSSPVMGGGDTSPPLGSTPFRDLTHRKT